VGDYRFADGVITAQVTRDGRLVEVSGSGTGPVEAMVNALAAQGCVLAVRDYTEHAMTAGADATAAAYVEAELDGVVRWGVGIDTDIVRACLLAVTSAANRRVSG
jgi:2-isopropylmalate synthase